MIKLGCVIGNDKSEHIISEDVRKDLFGGEKGFINTQSDLQPVCYSLERRLDHELEKFRFRNLFAGQLGQLCL